MTKKAKITIAIILGAGVLGAGGFFGYKYLYKTPKKVVATMQEKLSSEEIKTFHYKMNTAFSGEAEDQPYNVKLDIEGDIDNSSLKNSKTKNDISGSIEYQGVTFSTKLELRTIGEDLYLRMTKVPSIPLGDLPIDLSSLKDQWVKISPSELTGLYGIKAEEEAKKLTDAQEEELRKLFKEAEFFSEIEALKPETISGVKCYHYNVIIDKDALLDYLEKSFEITGEKMTSTDKKEIKKLLGYIDELSAELWIGKKDNLLYKIKSKFNIRIPDTKDKIGADFEITLSDYNKAVEVETPTDVKTLEDIMSEYLEDLYGGESLYEMPEGYEMPEDFETPTLP